MNGDRQRLRGHYDEDFYWECVDRNLGWLGDTTEEQRERQARLRDAVIGIGGAAAARLVRMGALNLKLADPDHFDLTNVQRQYGAGRDTIGRNKTTWDQDLSKRTYFGHPPAEASLESRV